MLLRSVVNTRLRTQPDNGCYGFEYSRIIANAALHEYAYSYTIEEEVSK